MSITRKRNRPYIVLFVVLLIILVYFGTERIISYNIWEKWEITTTTNDIENTIDLFDQSQMHTIKVVMTSDEYQSMLDTYTETSEKDYYEVAVVIDGVTIEEVGVRLKWNSSLMQAVGISPEEDEMGDREMEDMPWRPTPPWMESGTNEEMRMQIWWYGWVSWDNNTDYLPLLIRFDKYIEGQTYQWRTQIAIRKAGMGDNTLLAEPAAYAVYQSMGQPAPETSYVQVQVDGMDPYAYIASEVIDDEIYLNRYFSGDDGILFKVDSFSSFTYLWEDPTLYTEIFEQATNENDDDSAQLIDMLKFVSQSSDSDFDTYIDDYIDVDSVLYLMAIDAFMSNSDSFAGAWNNYYLYYHKWEGKFYMLTRDQNLAFGGMSQWWWGGWMWGWMRPEMMGETGTTEIAEAWSWEMLPPPMMDESWVMPEWMEANMWGWMPPEMMEGTSETLEMEMMWSWERSFPPTMTGEGNEMPEWMEDEREGWMSESTTNDLKDRLLANDEIKQRFDEIYEEVKNKVYGDLVLDTFFDTRTTVFFDRNEDHNLIDNDVYTQWVAKLKSFIVERINTTSDKINNLQMMWGK